MFSYWQPCILIFFMPLPAKGADAFFFFFGGGGRGGVVNTLLKSKGH